MHVLIELGSSRGSVFERWDQRLTRVVLWVDRVALWHSLFLFCLAIIKYSQFNKVSLLTLSVCLMKECLGLLLGNSSPIRPWIAPLNLSLVREGVETCLITPVIESDV